MGGLPLGVGQERQSALCGEMAGERLRLIIGVKQHGLVESRFDEAGAVAIVAGIWS